MYFLYGVEQTIIIYGIRRWWVSIIYDRNRERMSDHLITFRALRGV